VEIVGIHVHIGSQIVQAGPFLAALKRVLVFIRHLRSLGVSMTHLNIGGGLGIIYRNEEPQTAEQFARAVVPLLRASGLKIILEPGRFIVGNAGVLLTRVIYVKETAGKRFVVVDAGMNDLIRPSLYEAYHDVLPVNRIHRRGDDKLTDVVGPICESGDFLAKDRVMPRWEEGDLLSVMSAGAYGFSMASNYNSRCRAAEVLVKGTSFSLIRRRETMQDVTACERLV
jgi:diaminopimelate decarboxylase